MAFNPSTQINLCCVPFDSTYKNVVYFPSEIEQTAYFTGKTQRMITDYTTVRRTTPDGGFRSSVKVGDNIDLLRSKGINYMYYQNENHGTKFFYAFITQMVYINEGTTELVFETDVYQTWLFDVSLKRSYVVREHSEHDNFGGNIVPEKFNFQDYVYEEAETDTTLDEWGYLVGCTELNFETSSTSAGHLMSGIYQGLYFYYYENENHLSDFLAEFTVDAVQFIALIPKFCVSKASIGANETDRENGEGFMYANEDVATKYISFSFDATGANSHKFGNYKPKNNKLYTSPYYKLIVTNHNGEQAEYNIEDFFVDSNPEERIINFKMYGDISASPSVTLVPLYYKGIDENYDCGISISGFPQCSFASDTFKLWLAKNQYGVALDTVGNIGTIIAGIATATATGGAGSAIGVSMVASGATGVLNTINGVYQASKEPNKSHSGSSKNNLLTAIGQNKFSFYWQRIKKDHAKTVDDFFTMYGYATNRVKVPNVSSRPYWNYVQTIDVNIVGKSSTHGIPCDDMERLKAVYNNGVTLWKSNATIGDYSVDNSPTDPIIA